MKTIIYEKNKELLYLIDNPFDVQANSTKVIYMNSLCFVSTGIKINLPDDCSLIVRESLIKNVVILGCYLNGENEICLCVTTTNHNGTTMFYKDKIAKIEVVYNCPEKVRFVEIEDGKRKIMGDSTVASQQKE